MDLVTKNIQGLDDILSSKENGGWDLKKNWYKGTEFWKLRGLVGGGIGKSVYKLVLKKEWTTDSKENFEEKGIQGALGLVKATWKGEENEGNYKWETEEVTVDEQNKVWLIIAQGKNAMYLMPVVRNSDRCGWVDEKGRESNIKVSKREIETKGMETVSEWTKEYDRRGEWGKDQDGILKRQMSSGFSITRAVAASSWEEQFKGRDLQKESKFRKLIKEMKYENWVHLTGFGSQRYLYKNAGILGLKNINQEAKSCKEIEHYFPLDLVVLGKISVIGDEYTKKGFVERIDVYDRISKVIGVN